MEFIGGKNPRTKHTGIHFCSINISIGIRIGILGFFLADTLLHSMLVDPFKQSIDFVSLYHFFFCKQKEVEEPEPEITLEIIIFTTKQQLNNKKETNYVIDHGRIIIIIKKRVYEPGK